MTETAQATLTDFLLARAAEAERLHTDDCRLICWGSDEEGWCDCGGEQRARTQAEAQRQIVGLHRTSTEQQWVHELDGPDRQETEYNCEVCGWFPPGAACDTVRLLALPYADHPDYREEWRP